MRPMRTNKTTLVGHFPARIASTTPTGKHKVTGRMYASPTKPSNGDRDGQAPLACP